MEEMTPMSLERKRADNKVIQTKVIKGKGEEDFFLEADFTFGSTPFFKIESVDTWVDVYDATVINGNKVIFNAWVYKNIIFKVAGPASETGGVVTINGGIDHITKRIPLAGCIDIHLKDKEKVCPQEDIAEVLEAYVIGDVEENLYPTELEDGAGNGFVPPIYVYSGLHEKMCVRIAVKVVRWEHVEIEEKHC